MNTLPISKQQSRRLAGTLSAVLFALSVFGQTSAYYQKSGEPANGYWKLHTDVASHSTTVLFYNTLNQVVYQEVLRGQYIRLTRKNIRRLNETCDRLARNQLVARTVLPEMTLTDEAPARRESDPIFQGTGLRSDSLPTVLHASLIPFPNGRVRLYFTNPERANVSVSLEDKTGKVLYEERSNRDKYSRILNLNWLMRGDYQLVVNNRTRRYVYRLGLNYPIMQSTPIVLSSGNEPSAQWVKN